MPSVAASWDGGPLWRGAGCAFYLRLGRPWPRRQRQLGAQFGSGRGGLPVDEPGHPGSRHTTSWSQAISYGLRLERTRKVSAASLVSTKADSENGPTGGAISYTGVAGDPIRLGLSALLHSGHSCQHQDQNTRVRVRS